MSTRASSFAFADLWESVSAAVPDRTALVCGAQRLSFSELDDRASRLAGWLAARGVGPGSYVGVQMRNRSEHVEAMLAGYKLRAIPVNINYRLGPSELRYLYADCGLVGVIHDDELAADVAEASNGVAALRWTLATGPTYERAINTEPLVATTRCGDDLYALYTGGTTGNPKAVEWRMQDAFFACIGGGDPTGERGPVEVPADLVDRILTDRAFLPAAPLVHAAGMWTTLRWLLAGCKVVLLPRFVPAQIWAQIEGERVTTMNIVGDAMARPLLAALRDTELDLTCLTSIATGGAALSPQARDGLLAALPWLTVKDSYGSSETGVHGWAVHSAHTSATGFSTIDTAVLDPEFHRVLAPGTDEPGLVARRRRIPLRYHGDPAKSAATFRTVDGHRYALTGDLARIDLDGSLHLIGRSSQCINSGGEKIHPEEVEQVLRTHPGVEDAVVVGVPDERWGQQVVALVALRPDVVVTRDELQRHCRDSLAGYKNPKVLLFVPSVQRTVAGKADYRSAARTAVALLAPRDVMASPA